MNQNGSLTIDFVFAFILVMGFTMVLGFFAFSLSVVESVQYLTFSSSRDYFAGHTTQAKQTELAEKKFNELSKTGSFNTLLRKDWFDVKINKIGNSGNVYGANASTNDIFEGVRTQVTVGLLEFNIPFLGSTEGDQKYETFLTSFLGREPSSAECMEVIDKRYNAILNLDEYRSGTINPSAYMAIDDNGC